MTNQHPITPPPELVQQWAIASPIQPNDEDWAYELYIAHNVSRWSADQELEACVGEMRDMEGDSVADDLRAARRPKPLSLKEQALEELDKWGYLNAESADTIRHALEQLP